MISIVSITFNNYEELVETLASIENVADVQSLVINGGKCEKTKNYLKTHKGIAVSESDRGISDAFNKGIAHSTGTSMMFLNSGDILLDKNYLEWANSVFENQTDIDYTYSDIIYNDADLGKTLVSAKNSEERSIARGMPYPHQSLIVRRSVFEKVGSFDESFRLAMDFDLILRMKKNNSVGLYYNKPTVLMDGNGVSSKNDFKAIKETYRAIVKNNRQTFPVVFRLFVSIQICYFKMLLRFFGLKSILKSVKVKRYQV